MNGERSLGVTTWTLPVRGVEALRWAGDHGLRLVHLDRYDAQMCSRSGLLCEVARGLGVKLAALGMRELERCGTEDLSRARQVIDADIDLACELGVEYVWLPSFNAAQIRDRDGLFRVAELLSYALSRGASMSVASENTLSGAENIELFGIVDDRRACLLFDTQNPVLFGLDPVLLASQVAHLVGAYVHVKDGVSGEGDANIGSGAANVFATLRMLVDRGFNGELVLENNYKEAATQRLDADVAVLNNGFWSSHS